MLSDGEQDDADTCANTRIDKRKQALQQWRRRQQQQQQQQQRNKATRAPFVVSRPKPSVWQLNDVTNTTKTAGSAAPKKKTGSQQQRQPQAQQRTRRSTRLSRAAETTTASPSTEQDKTGKAGAANDKQDTRKRLADVFSASSNVQAQELSDLMSQIDFGLIGNAASAMDATEVAEARACDGTDDSATVTPAPTALEQELLDSATATSAASSNGMADIEDAQGTLVPDTAAAMPAALQTADGGASALGGLNETKTPEFYRQQMLAERARLEGLCQQWTQEIGQLGDHEIVGDIRATIGQAQLLSSQRFTQYEGLCDRAENPQADRQAFVSDLEGFWDVIMMQVDDVHSRFEKMQAIKENGWKDNAPPDPPKKKKRTATPPKRVTRSSAKAKQSDARAAARERLRKFKQALQAEQAQLKPSPALGKLAAAEAVGSRPMLTPVRASKREREEHGSNFILTPVRRSTRKTPSRYRQTSLQHEQTVSTLLETTGYVYKPNPLVPSPGVTSTAIKSPRRRGSYLPSPMPSVHEEETTDDAGASDWTKYLAPAPVLDLPIMDEGFSPESTAPATSEAAPAAAAAASSNLLVSFSPAPNRVAASQGARVFQAATAASGTFVSLAQVTPSRRIRQLLGSDPVFSPVRRSARNAQPNPADATTSEALFGYLPNPSLL